MNLRQVDLNLLVALDALLAECHVSRAAEKLGLSQPAMSRMLGRMRDMFGDPLLVRGQGGLIPTERAQELVPRVRDILDQTAQILEKQTFDPARTDRQFRLRATHYGMQVFLPGMVAAFVKAAPHAELIIDAMDAYSLERERAPETDLAIVPDMIRVPEGHFQKKLWQDPFVCLMAADHPLAAGPLTLEGYLAYRHILVTMGGGPRSAVDDILAAMGKRRSTFVHIPSAAAALAMLPGTDLLIIQTTLMALPLAEQLGLVWKPLPFELPPATYSLAWHPVHHHHEAHRWFRKFVYTEIRRALAGEGAP